MLKRLPTFLPRIAVLVIVALAATAGLTFAAGSKVASAPAVPTVDTTVAPPLVVPDVRNQAFVFAKGALADAGFAWRVVGSVHGYAANIVVSQSPAAGSHLIDTGAPLVTLTLKRNGSYTEAGDASDTSPYPGTVVQPSDLAGNAIGPANPAPTDGVPVVKTPKAVKKPAKTPAKTPAKATPAPQTAAATPATTPASTATTPATTTATPPAAAKTAKAAPEATWPKTRPVAFTVPGAKKEPLDEMPLPDRAKALMTWLEAHPAQSAAAATYWLYQNEWIVTGAKLGWWRGAEALQTLIAVDRHAQSLWGIGAKSAVAAQQALDEVRAKAKS
jgi:hypothetical protein